LCEENKLNVGSGRSLPLTMELEIPGLLYLKLIQHKERSLDFMFEYLTAYIEASRSVAMLSNCYPLIAGLLLRMLL